ncbi:MAG: hypothetical protein DCC75_09790 [Proteobacteria bacterium]|nr:MAG: hypothetical protein DCC75_09790 [Pseudomonadota bacterium]
MGARIGYGAGVDKHCNKILETVSESSRRELLKAALDACSQYRAVILKYWREGFKTTFKEDSTYVTDADRAAEEQFREWAGKHYPEFGILGEEFGHANPEAEYQWVIDPIDGTAEFAHRSPLWGSLLGLYCREVYAAAYGLGLTKNGQVLPALPRNDGKINTLRVAVSASRNFRRWSDNLEIFLRIAKTDANLRIYCSCFTQAQVVSAGLDVDIVWANNLWDLAGVHAMLPEIGGKFIFLQKPESFSGKPYSAIYGQSAAVDTVLAEIGWDDGINDI